jgi:UDP-glucuronate decarboxylase
MNILITGAAGFIGINLTKRMLSLGHNVIAIDNFYASRRKNIKQFEDNSNYTFIEHDVRYPFPKFDVKLDWIFNLACPASPIHYQRDHIMTLDTNIEGIKNVVQVALENDSVLLHTSTSEVYGDPLEHPQKETYNGNVSTIGSHACYKEGKRVAETYLINYIRHSGLKGKIIRIFNTYGPYMDPYDGRVVSNFIYQALTDKDITVHGEGLQTRSFQYVDDLLDGMLHVINSDEAFTGPVNLGNPGEFTIKELAEKILEKVTSNSKIIFTPVRDDDPKVRKPDITFAKNTFGWEPKIQLSEGLDSTIEYFKKLMAEKSTVTIDDNSITNFVNDTCSKLVSKGYDFSTLEIDHVCYYCKDLDEYNDKKLELGEYATLVSEKRVKDKTVGFYKLLQPLKFENSIIDSLEIVVSAVGQELRSGFDHFEYVVKHPLERLVSEFAHIEFDTSTIKNEDFAKVSLNLEDGNRVRFHTQRLLEEI